MHGVHRNKKYCFKGLFLKNINVTRFLSLQFNGLLFGHFFCRDGYEAAGGERLPEAFWRPIMRSRRRTDCSSLF
jgi:hypothetical protein